MDEVTIPGARSATVALDEVELHVYEAGERGAPTVVLCHGFPELAYSWRHQIPALADAGYRVLAPDQRGYGRSSRPEAVEAYDIEHLTGDVLALLDHDGADQAVVVGHDWGSIVAWNLALMAPQRLRGVVGMSVPFIPRPTAPPTQRMRELMGDNFFYMLYFQEPGVADADLGADPAVTMRRFLAGLSPDGAAGADPMAMFAPDGRGMVERLPDVERLPGWLGQAELDHYVAEFRRTGFTGPINWYRNLDRNWELTPHLDGAKVTVPSLFVTGTLDPVNLMSPASSMDGHLDDHRGSHYVDGAGHWVQQEKPTEVNEALLGFLASVA